MSQHYNNNIVIARNERKIILNENSRAYCQLCCISVHWRVSTEVWRSFGQWMQVQYPGTTAWARAITDVLDSWCIFDFDTNSFSSVNEREVKSVQITGARPSGRGPGPYCCRCFCLSLYYHYLSTVQSNHFRPSQSHSATESQLFRFSVKIFSRSALAGGPEKNFFTVTRTRCRLLCLLALRREAWWGWIAGGL